MPWPAKRHDARQAMTLRDERFVFMRSFNEFFIALGVVLLGIGLWTASRSDSQMATAMAWAFPVIVWGLAEYLTAQKRYALPSIVLAVLFVVAVVLLASRFPETLPASGNEHSFSWLPSFMQADTFTGCATTLLAAIAFYVRFRLPFSLLMIVASAIPLVLMSTERLIGFPDEGSVTVALLILGLIVFAVALRFDMSDRERLTRRSDCAFWLMLAAAPLIVHPVVSLVTKGNHNGTRGQSYHTWHRRRIRTGRIDRRSPRISCLDPYLPRRDAGFRNRRDCRRRQCIVGHARRHGRRGRPPRRRLANGARLRHAPASRFARFTFSHDQVLLNAND